MGDVELDAPDLDDVHEEAGRFRRMVALGVVLITLLGATVAYFQAVESNKEDVAARNAQRDAVAGLGAQVDGTAALLADLRISSGIDVQILRQAINATRVQSATGDGSVDPDLDVHRAAQVRFAAVSEAISGLTTIDPSDPATSADAFAAANENTDVARLRQTVRADLADDHGGKADSYVAVLTVLAVALFLLGLSLTVQGRNRYILAAPGVVIAMVCVVWSLFIAGRDITRVSTRSIELAAEGQRLLDAGDVEAAIDAYDEAIDDSPDFAAAYSRRAAARFIQGSPQAGQVQFISITSDDALEGSLEDLERALELGAGSDGATLAEAGFDTLLDGQFERSVELSTEALELNDRLAPVWFNLGVAHVALGDEDEAARAYRRGMRVLDDSAIGLREDVLAAARTDLAVLREILDGDELEDRLDLIVTTEIELAEFELGFECEMQGCSPLDDADDVELGDAVFGRSNAFITVDVPVDGVAPGDVVGVAWLYRPDDSLPFQQPPVFGFSTVAVGDDGFLFDSTLPSVDPACPVSGEFSVRLYGGEELLGEVSGSVEPMQLAESFTTAADAVEGFEAFVPEGLEQTASEVTELDPFTIFGTQDDPVQIGVNVTPGAALEIDDPTAFAAEVLQGFIPGATPGTAFFTGRGLDGSFVEIEAQFAVDEADGVAAAIAIGPDTSSRTILLTGAVSEQLLLDAIATVTFTGVGTPPG